LDKKSVLKYSLRGGGINSISVIVRFVLGLFVQIIMTRELDPIFFGQIAFASAVGLFFNNIVNSNGDKYLIQNKKDSKITLDVVFTLELLLALFFFIIIFMFSNIFMSFSGKPYLTIYTKVIAFTYFFTPFSRPRCLYEQNLDFFKAKIPFITSLVFSSLITIFAVYGGYGIWALIMWRISVPFLEIFFLWIQTSYYPKIKWDINKIKDILNFGWPLIFAGTFSFFTINIPYYIFNLTLIDSELQSGYFWLAFQICQYFISGRSIIYNVFFPIFSKISNESYKINLFDQISKVTGLFYLFPIILSIYFSEDLITLVYGDKWINAVIPFRIILISTLVKAINSNVGYFLHSQGITKMAIVNPLIQTTLLLPLGYLASKQFGINGMAFSIVLVDIISASIIYRFFIKKLSGKGFNFYFRVPLLFSIYSLFLTFINDYYGMNIFFRFLIIIIFLSYCYIFHIKEYYIKIRKGIKAI